MANTENLTSEAPKVEEENKENSPGTDSPQAGEATVEKTDEIKTEEESKENSEDTSDNSDEDAPRPDDNEPVMNMKQLRSTKKENIKVKNENKSLKEENESLKQKLEGYKTADGQDFDVILQENATLKEKLQAFEDEKQEAVKKEALKEAGLSEGLLTTLKGSEEEWKETLKTLIENIKKTPSKRLTNDSVSNGLSDKYKNYSDPADRRKRAREAMSRR
jgi:hypothetical protein